MGLLLADTMWNDPMLDDVMPLWIDASEPVYEPTSEDDECAFASDAVAEDARPWFACWPQLRTFDGACGTRSRR